MAAGSHATSTRPSADIRPAGLRALIPGYAQWFWGQRQRGLVLLGSYLAALTVGLFAWGTWTSLLVLGFAFVAHATSAADAIRQGAFPGFGRWVPAVSATAGLGLGCYVPALALASALAWPGQREDGSPDAFLVNRWAYRASEPRTGDSLWFHSLESRT